MSKKGLGNFSFRFESFWFFLGYFSALRKLDAMGEEAGHFKKYLMFFYNEYS